MNNFRIPSFAEEQAEAAARVEWAANPELRAEFGDNEDAYIAYCKAEARGVVSFHGGKGLFKTKVPSR
jgi:hypothetical protein